MEKQRLAGPSRWTSIDDYLVGLARDRRARDSRRPKPRTEPEAPSLTLGALPFVALLGAMAVLMIAIFAAAWPAAQPEMKPQQAAAPNAPGRAGAQWWQEAKKEMR